MNERGYLFEFGFQNDKLNLQFYGKYLLLLYEYIQNCPSVCCTKFTKTLANVSKFTLLLMKKTRLLTTLYKNINKHLFRKN